MRLILTLLIIALSTISKAQVYSCIDGEVYFISEAPLEIITASSQKLQGALDVNTKTFAFQIYIKSFDGFNNSLQREHFYENYMEVNEYPLATFKGKLLEQIDNDRAKYRAKGILNIHGIEVERIIEVNLGFNESSIDFYSTSVVALEDHKIHLPRIVYQKIAEEILVTVQGSLNLRE